ncbi:NAD-dependent epimerase/dehydratase family protein [uncultured Legionella sp.]|uniref:NAD-dependent epimerase/dehydratase family protein n=1 Tax=uncultured Legionella sp. TaxID=210934 RepID=UPI00261E41CC|nr:NAD-dependent epimerase/dehydratase family protein [uncultured Legionella sp.]
MSKILVTGATGFVGRSLVPALLQNGHEVRCAVSQKVDWLQAEQTVINRLELQSDWSEVLKDIDIVIHLAARVHIMKEKVETGTTSLDEYCKVNSTATKNLAQQAAQYGVKRFVFLSSIKVNGEFTFDKPFTEDSLTQPDDPYGLSKLYAEQELQAISKQTEMEVVILRPPLIFGPGVKANFLKMLQLVNKGWPLPFGKVDNKRNFVFIENLVSAICTVATEPGAANQLYLVADDDAWSLSDLLGLIAQEMNVKSRLFAVPGIIHLFKLLGLSNMNRRLFGSLEVNNHKLKSQLGWRPPVSSAEGLAKTVKWYQNEYKL